jgi:hypothetical protein|tara:strand:- start:115 stop:321 length:207 start_codon:yes stop_codon:yes gene_type:complete
MTKEFKVINTPRHDRFEESITKLLSDNWELHGSPFVSQTGGMTQALVREVKAPFKQPAKTKAKTNEVS